VANSLFSGYKQCLIGDAAGPGLTAPNWESGDIRAILVDHGVDTPVPNTDANLSAITAGARVAVSANLGTKTSVLSGNTLTQSAANTTFTAVTGASCESILLYGHTGTDTTSLLLVFFDTGVTGLPVTPNGGDITIQWNGSGIWSW
jgi:hypothetical protein